MREKENMKHEEIMTRLKTAHVELIEISKKMGESVFKIKALASQPWLKCRKCGAMQPMRPMEVEGKTNVK